MSTIVPTTYKDIQINGYHNALTDLATETHATLIELKRGEKHPKSVAKWLGSITDNEGIATKPYFQTQLEPYWILLSNYYWILFIPMVKKDIIIG